MLWSTIPFVVALAGATAARVVPDSHVVLEERQSVSRRWIRRSRATPHAILPVRIGLAQSNLDEAHDYLMDVSQPNSPNYGKHWTAEEVIETFRPSNQTIEAVREWLVDAGISAKQIILSDNKAWFAFDASTNQMESLLHTEYYEYEDTITGGIMPACDSYHVSKHVKEHIDYITPGVKLMAPMGDKATEEGWKRLQKRNVAQQPPSSWLGPARSKSRWRPMLPNWSQLGWPQVKDNVSNCDQVISPACIAALYKIPPASRHPIEGNSMGVFEAQLQYWDQQDLDNFFTNFTNIPNGTHPFDNDIDGGVAVTTNLSEAGPEAVLDLEAELPIIYPQNVTIFNVDDLNYQSWLNDTYTWGFNTLLDAIDGSYCTYSAYGETGDLAGIDPTYPDPSPGGYKGSLQCGVFKPTNIFAISYGGQEADVPVAYQKRQCNEFLKLGLQGMSIFFASGDTGVANMPNNPADNSEDGPTGCLGPNEDVFNPAWPICPYITSVGGTQLPPGQSVKGYPQPEVAAFQLPTSQDPFFFASGGGFSNIFATPDYQKTAFEIYFTHHAPPFPYYSALAEVTSDVYAKPNITALLAGSTGGLYNRIGRGYPDVSAVAQNLAGYVGGQFGTVDGTSGSCQIFGAIINRINEERLQLGKKTVGFLNPTLYAHPEVFNDVTNGTNAACLGKGFDAVEGWDPVTGLGTPNYPKMLELFLSLP